MIYYIFKSLYKKKINFQMKNMFIRKNKYNVNKYLEKNINSNIYKKVI